VTPVRVRAVLLAALLGLATLTGCMSIPTTGPVKLVPGEAEVCQSCVNVEVAPPTPGADPRQIVDGYLRANSNYQPNYAIARQFLTAQAADTWQPELGARIYSSATPTGSGDRIRLKFQLTGSLAADRTYRAQNKPAEEDFGLVRENGEWRIDRPPEGLMVEEYAFDRFYTGYSRYFIGNGRSLVPERIYLPALRNPANVAAALVTGLLAGPSDWLTPAVTSAIPQGTSLIGDSVTITDDGIAGVALSEDVLTLDDPTRSQLGAQIVFTLQQVSGVQGVQITVNQQKFRVPEADPSLVLATNAFSTEIEPVPVVSDQSYALRGGRVHAVRASGETASLEPVMGPLGEKGADASSLAVSGNGTEVAAVTDDATTLRRTSIGTGGVTTLRSGLTDMLRPQFSRYGELWTIAREAGRQQLFLFRGDRYVPVDATVLNGRVITAFRISPDGARMALVWRTDAGKDQLGLARIIRGNRVIVDEWRPVDVQQEGSTQVVQIADVAWLDANELLLLGTTDEDAPQVPVRVVADASEVVAEAGEPGWNADQLTVLPRQQSVVVVGTQDRAWRDDGSRWRPYLEDVEAVAYAG
jgi:hypothetical protein